MIAKRVVKQMDSAYRGVNLLKRWLRQREATNFGVGLLSHTMQYCGDFESDLHEKVFSTEITSIQFNLAYLHAWLIKNRIDELQYNKRLSYGSRQARSFERTLQLIIMNDNVLVYSNEPDDMVLQELERARRVLWRQLDNHFLYTASDELVDGESSLQAQLAGFNYTFKRDLETPLADIIHYDVLNESMVAERDQDDDTEPPAVTALSDYIHSRFKLMRSLDEMDLKELDAYWLA